MRTPASAQGLRRFSHSSILNPGSGSQKAGTSLDGEEVWGDVLGEYEGAKETGDSLGDMDGMA